MFQKRGGSLESTDVLPIGARFENTIIAYCRYLGKILWPENLAIFYPHPGYSPMGWVLLAAGFLFGLSLVFYMQRWRHPYLLMGWLWFVGTLVPMIGLVQTGSQSMADRHTYLPSLGLLIFVVWGGYELTQHWRFHSSVMPVAASLIVLLIALVTRHQLGFWQNNETLFKHAVAVTENNYLARNSLGNVLFGKGQIDEAIGQYQEAIRLEPDYAEAHYNLGNVFLGNGQTDEAISQYQEAIRSKPDFMDPHINLGNALLGKGQADDAINQFQTAIQLKPDFADAHYNLGNAFLDKGQTDEAIRQYQEVVGLNQIMLKHISISVMHSLRRD